MSIAIFTSLFNPVAAIVGNTTADQPKSRRAPSKVCRANRTQAVLKTASLLVNKLEKEDYDAAFKGLYRLKPEDRVSVAEVMLFINKQHRSIITSLPRFSCSFLSAGDLRQDIACIEISCTDPNGRLTSNTFSFHTGSRSLA